MRVTKLDDKGVKPWLSTTTPLTLSDRDFRVRVENDTSRMGFFDRLFTREHHSKVIDAWVEKSDNTYRVKTTVEYDGLFFGKVSKSTYWMSCFPGGDEYPWYTKDLNEAKDKCLEILWLSCN